MKRKEERPIMTRGEFANKHWDCGNRPRNTDDGKLERIACPCGKTWQGQSTGDAVSDATLGVELG